MSIVMFGVFMTLAGILGMSVDLGILFTTKRQLQAAVDLAALKASTDLDNRADIVSEVMDANGFLDTLSAAPTIVTGRFPATGYSMDTVTALPLEDRFEEGAANPNGLRVSAKTIPTLYLSRLFYREPITVTAAATTGNFPLTQVAVRTTTLSFDSTKSPVFDAVLSSLLGSSVSLSAAGYDGLVGGNIQLLGFLDALAVGTGVTAGAYDALLVEQVTLPEVIQAAITAIAGDPNFVGDKAAVTAILTSLGGLGAGRPFALADFLTYDVEDPEKTASARLNLLDLLTGSSEAANMRNGTMTTVSLPFAGGSATITVGIVEPMQISAIGGVGVRAETAQARYYIELTPTDQLALGLLNLNVRLPLLFEMSKGTATVTAITCPTPDPADGTVDVSAQSSTLNFAFADVDPNTLGQSGSLTTSPGTIVSYGSVLQVTATGDTTYLGQSAALVFGAAFDRNNFQSVSTTSPASSAASDLLDAMALNVTIVGLPGISTGMVTSGLAPILDGVAPALDTVVNSIAEALGVRIGTMDAGVPYLKCSNPMLIQ